METTSFPLNGQEYRIGRLSAMTQFHVSRKILPLLAQVGLSLESLRSLNTAAMMEIVGPASSVLAAMSMEDADYVVGTCLGAVQRRQGEGWQRVWVQGGGLVFQDIDMLHMLRLVVEVLKENLGGFFAVPAGAPDTKPS